MPALSLLSRRNDRSSLGPVFVWITELLAQVFVPLLGAIKREQLGFVCVFVCDCHVLLQHPGTNYDEQIPSSARCGFSIFRVSTRNGLQKLQEPSSDELCIINLERAKRFCNAPDTAKSEPYRSLTCHRHVQAEHTVGTNHLNKLIIVPPWHIIYSWRMPLLVSMSCLENVSPKTEN